MSRIAIIPARAGSKGLPDKNIRSLAGKPLIVWSIDAALASGAFDQVVVSTDSEVYAKIAQNAGALVPGLRSPELATDQAGSAEVIIEILDKLKLNQGDFTLLQPTSPLRNSGDILNALKLFDEKHANAVVSVCEMEHSPLWSNTLDESLSLEHFIRNEAKGKRRQDLPTHYRLNGAVYIARDDFFREQKGFFGPQSYASVMPVNRSVDIDTLYDFEFAEWSIQRSLEYKD